MTILFRYLLREYGKIFTMCFSGLMTIYLVIDFFEKVRRFLHYNADWLDILTYFLLKAPAISYQIAPLAILMATLLTFGLLSRSHEITAMRSCGISLRWIITPFLSLPQESPLCSYSSVRLSFRWLPASPKRFGPHASKTNLPPQPCCSSS